MSSSANAKCLSLVVAPVKEAKYATRTPPLTTKEGSAFNTPQEGICMLLPGLVPLNSIHGSSLEVRSGVGPCEQFHGTPSGEDDLGDLDHG